MPRKSAAADSSASVFGGDEPEQVKPASASRVSVPLTPDGAIDFDRMSASGKEKLKSAFTASGMATGVVNPHEPPQEQFPRQMVPHIYESLTTVIRSTGKIFFKWPDDFAAMIKFSDEEKSNLTEPTGAMLDKYAPRLNKYAVELQFAAALSSNFSSMVQRAVSQYSEIKQLEAMAAQQQRTEAESAPAERPHNVIA